MKNPTETAPRTFTLDAVRPTQGGLTVKTGVIAGRAKTADKNAAQLDAYIKQ